MQTVVALLIVLLAAVGIGRKVVRLVRGQEGCAACGGKGCGCGCEGSCGGCDACHKGCGCETMEKKS